MQYFRTNNRTKAKIFFVTNRSTIQLFNYSTIILILFNSLILPAHALEDCVIMAQGKLTDIRIEDNTVLNVYPLITIMNDKNTLMVSPLKEGKTNFSVLKNNRERFVFEVEVTKNGTSIKEVKGFDILTIDEPETDKFELDEPPKKLGGKING